MFDVDADIEAACEYLLNTDIKFARRGKEYKEGFREVCLARRQLSEALDTHESTWKQAMRTAENKIMKSTSKTFKKATELIKVSYL